MAFLAALLCIPFLGVDGTAEVIMIVVLCCLASAIGIGVGVFTVLVSQWMKQLRGWGWSLASVILCFLCALLVCPLFFVVAIWPLVVLVDSEVRDCFDQKAV